MWFVKESKLARLADKISEVVNIDRLIDKEVDKILVHFSVACHKSNQTYLSKTLNKQMKKERSKKKMADFFVL